MTKVPVSLTPEHAALLTRFRTMLNGPFINLHIRRDIEMMEKVLESIPAMLEQARAEAVRPFVEALTPSGETKAAYIGEFTFPFTADLGDDGEETITMTVPWTTTKEIMKAILSRATRKGSDDGE